MRTQVRKQRQSDLHQAIVISYNAEEATPIALDRKKIILLSKNLKQNEAQSACVESIFKGVN